MHLGDSIFIFILALVLFGPKKLPEMAKQIGKLMAEFRRASNDFRMQIDEELRTMERQEQQKKQEAERAASSSEPCLLPPASAGDLAASSETGLQLLPPSLGEQVSAGTPYAVSATPTDASTEAAPATVLAEDHPLLRVDTIPPQEDETLPTGIAAAEANAALVERPPATELESEQTAVPNG